jgi:hypothetical protein
MPGKPKAGRQTYSVRDNYGFTAGFKRITISLWAEMAFTSQGQPEQVNHKGNH